MSEEEIKKQIDELAEVKFKQEVEKNIDKLVGEKLTGKIKEIESAYGESLKNALKDQQSNMEKIFEEKYQKLRDEYTERQKFDSIKMSNLQRAVTNTVSIAKKGEWK